MSNAAIIGNHIVTSDQGPPIIAGLDASIEATSTGTITGKNKSGSITSLAFVFIAIAENSVPTAEIPRVDSNATGINSRADMGKLYRTAKIGKVIISMISIKVKVDSTLPK